MQRATELKCTIGELKTNQNKLQLDAKYSAEAVKCRISIEKSPTKVTEGNRVAAKEEEYLDAIKTYTTQKKAYEYYEIIYDVVKDIAFQSWSIWDKCNKNK